MSLHVIIISCVTEKQHPTTLWWMIKSQVVLKALKYMFWSIVCPLVHQFFFPTSRKETKKTSIQGCVIAEHGNPWSGAQVLLLGK